MVDLSAIPTSSLAAWLEPGQSGDRWQHGKDGIVAMEVEKLLIDDSPRINRENPGHWKAMAEVEDELPPIIVHHETMRVIDGIHRVRAAKARGDTQILARCFHGDEADAFILAVKSNIAHGLPLTLADRKAAANRILASHQHWSDRMVASVTGLAARTVAEIRKQAGNVPQTRARVGKDGRMRPVDGTARRMIAYHLMRNDPGLSLRQVAQIAGVSPETARAVRKLLQHDKGPVPGRTAKNRASSNDTSEKLKSSPGDLTDRPEGDGQAAEIHPVVMERLRADPALRYTDTGRALLRMLQLHLMQTAQWEKVCANVPPHCSGIVADLARECASRWLQLSLQLERKGSLSGL